MKEKEAREKQNKPPTMFICLLHCIIVLSEVTPVLVHSAAINKAKDARILMHRHVSQAKADLGPCFY